MFGMAANPELVAVRSDLLQWIGQLDEWAEQPWLEGLRSERGHRLADNLDHALHSFRGAAKDLEATVTRKIVQGD